MLSGPFLDRNWIGQNEDYNTSDIVMLGLPFDGTVSYRSGSRFAPEQIRLASWGMEDYSPRFDRHLQDVNFHDAGDLEFPLGNTYKSLDLIEKNVEEIYKDGKRVFGIGGEHLVTLPEIKAVSKFYKNLAIVHFDAHTDLREEYLGEEMSHSAVIRHVSKIVGPENIKQIGIRSGMKEEWEFMKEHNTLISKYSELDVFKGKKVFVTVDLDVLDPSVIPGTGTPDMALFQNDHSLRSAVRRSNGRHGAAYASAYDDNISLNGSGNGDHRLTSRPSVSALTCRSV